MTGHRNGVKKHNTLVKKFIHFTIRNIRDFTLTPRT